MRGGGVFFKNAFFIAFSGVSRQFRPINFNCEGEMSNLPHVKFLRSDDQNQAGLTRRAVFDLLLTHGAPLLLSYPRKATMAKLLSKSKMK